MYIKTKLGWGHNPELQNPEYKIPNYKIPNYKIPNHRIPNYKILKNCTVLVLKIARRQNVHDKNLKMAS